MKMKRATKIKGLQDELSYCKAKIVEGSRLEHWRIREYEIEKELKLIKRKKR